MVGIVGKRVGTREADDLPLGRSCLGVGGSHAGLWDRENFLL